MGSESFHKVFVRWFSSCRVAWASRRADMSQSARCWGLLAGYSAGPGIDPEIARAFVWNSRRIYVAMGRGASPVAETRCRQRPVIILHRPTPDCRPQCGETAHHLAGVENSCARATRFAPGPTARSGDGRLPRSLPDRHTFSGSSVPAAAIGAAATALTRPQRNTSRSSARRRRQAWFCRA